jgi:regulator of replication initiation timing
MNGNAALTYYQQEVGRITRSQAELLRSNQQLAAENARLSARLQRVEAAYSALREAATTKIRAAGRLVQLLQTDLDAARGAVATVMDSGERKCGVEWCKRAAHRNGYCWKHVQRRVKWGDPLLYQRGKRMVRETADGWEPIDWSLTCEVKWCEHLRLGRAYCTNHYRRWKKYGDPLLLKLERSGPARLFRETGPNTYEAVELLATERPCDIPWCGNKHYCRGFCRTHYYRMRKHGDPTLTKRNLHGIMVLCQETARDRFRQVEEIPRAQIVKAGPWSGQWKGKMLTFLRTHCLHPETTVCPSSCEHHQASGHWWGCAHPAHPNAGMEDIQHHE